MGQAYVFIRVCDSVHRRGGSGIPACIAGGIPAYLAADLQGVVSQHALQVSRPTPKGEVDGVGACSRKCLLGGGGLVHGGGAARDSYLPVFEFELATCF